MGLSLWNLHKSLLEKKTDSDSQQLFFFHFLNRSNQKFISTHSFSTGSEQASVWYNENVHDTAEHSRTGEQRNTTFYFLSSNPVEKWIIGLIVGENNCYLLLQEITVKALMYLQEISAQQRITKDTNWHTDTLHVTTQLLWGSATSLYNRPEPTN